VTFIAYCKENCKCSFLAMFAVIIDQTSIIGMNSQAMLMKQYVLFKAAAQ